MRANADYCCGLARRLARCAPLSTTIKNRPLLECVQLAVLVNGSRAVCVTAFVRHAFPCYTPNHPPNCECCSAVIT